MPKLYERIWFNGHFLHTYAKLLRLIEEKQYRPVGERKYHGLIARLLASTNKDLERGVQDGDIRRDLYYRLKQIQLNLPP